MFFLVSFLIPYMICGLLRSGFSCDFNVLKCIETCFVAQHMVCLMSLDEWIFCGLLGIVFSRYQLDRMTDSISKIFVLAEFWREWGGEMSVYCIVEIWVKIVNFGEFIFFPFIISIFAYLFWGPHWCIHLISIVASQWFAPFNITKCPLKKSLEIFFVLKPALAGV